MNDEKLYKIYIAFLSIFTLAALAITLSLLFTGCNPIDVVKDECKDAVKDEVANAVQQCFDQIQMVRDECQKNADEATTECQAAIDDVKAWLDAWAERKAREWLTNVGCVETPDAGVGWDCSAVQDLCSCP